MNRSRRRIFAPPQATQPTLNTVCPFCPLRCIDTRASSAGFGLVDSSICVLAVQRRSRLAELAAEQIQHDAVHTASRILSASRSVLVSGTILDVQTARAAIEFAAKYRGCVDVVRSSVDNNLNSVAEREGWVGSTLNEVSSRADAVVFVGNVLDAYPQIINRICTSPARSGSVGPRFLQVSGEPSTVASEIQYQYLPVGSAGDLVGLLANERSELNNWLSQNSYTAFFIGRGPFDLVASGALNRCIAQLNRTARAVLVSLSEAITFSNVSLWLTGFAGPVDFRSPLPRLLDTTPSFFRTGSEHLTAETLIWLQPLPDCPLPNFRAEPEMGIKNLIVIGTADKELAQHSDAYIRSAIPGIETAGTTYRGDGTVVLPFLKSVENNLPSASEILKELSDLC